jgi:glucose/arabinose dehydrogenase
LVDAGKADRRLAGYRAPEGVKVEVAVERPAAGRLVGLAFADDGTPHVVERASGRKGAVQALSSSKGDGVWDRARAVLEGESVSAVLFHDGWLYAAGESGVRRHRPARLGEPPGVKEVVVRSLRATGLTLGPDGWLYVSAGRGDHRVEGADGSRATVLGTGAVFRCRPDGGRMHPFATGFTRPGRGAFDLAGQMFLADGAGKPGGRLLHVPDGADFGQDPTMLGTGPGGPGGLLIYNDTRFPEELRGLLLCPDPGRRAVRAYRVEPAGASYRAVEEFDFLSAPKDEDFRPCQAVLGPDGAVYVVDQRKEGAAGRVYRLSWAGAGDRPALALRGLDSWVKVAALKDEELVKALSGDEASDRERARRELVRRGGRNRAALLKLLRSGDAAPAAQINAAGALQWLYDADVQKGFVAALAEGDADLRRVVAEALGLWAKKGDRAVQDGLLKALADEDRAVRRAVALAMGRLAGPGAGDNLARTLSFDDGKDPCLRGGLVRALEMLGKPGIDTLIALADSGVQQDLDRVVESFARLRTRPAFEALPRLLNNPHLSGGQRAELVRSCGNYRLDPPVSLEPVVAWLAGQPKETPGVKKAMLEVLAAAGARGGKKGEAFARAMLTDDDEEVRRLAAKLLREREKGRR